MIVDRDRDDVYELRFYRKVPKSSIGVKHKYTEKVRNTRGMEPGDGCDRESLLCKDVMSLDLDQGSSSILDA